MSRIGYYQLSEVERQVYIQFELAFNSYTSSVDLKGIMRNVDVMKILQVALGDNPQVIYFNKTRIRVVETIFGNKCIQFCGIDSTSQVRNMRKQLENSLNKALDEIEALNPLNNYDRLLCIYEYMQDNISYDTKELEECSRMGWSINHVSHNAYGALVKKSAVCDGISAAFSLIAQKMGFDCTVVNGRVAICTGDFSEHAWNVIKIGENYYHIDATWDINQREQSGEYRYDYFCVSDSSICKDRDWDISSTPTCSSEDYSFYVKNQCLASNTSQLRDIFKRYSKSKQRTVRVKITEDLFIPKPEDRFLCDMLVDIAASVGRHKALKYSWNKNMRCFCAKFDS